MGDMLICEACGFRVTDHAWFHPRCTNCNGKLIRKIEWPEDSADIKRLAECYADLADEHEREITALRNAYRDAETLARVWFAKSKDSNIPDATASSALAIGDAEARASALKADRDSLLGVLGASRQQEHMFRSKIALLHRNNRLLSDHIGVSALICDGCGYPRFACVCESKGASDDGPQT